MFIPEHCPNPLCRNYTTQGQAEWYSRLGSYKTISYGLVARFLCKTCRQGFSRRTFAENESTRRLIHYHSIYQQCISRFQNHREDDEFGFVAAYLEEDYGNP